MSANNLSEVKDFFSDLDPGVGPQKGPGVYTLIEGAAGKPASMRVVLMTFLEDYGVSDLKKILDSAAEKKALYQLYLEWAKLNTPDRKPYPFRCVIWAANQKVAIKDPAFAFVLESRRDGYKKYSGTKSPKSVSTSAKVKSKPAPVKAPKKLPSGFVTPDHDKAILGMNQATANVYAKKARQLKWPSAVADAIEDFPELLRAIRSLAALEAVEGELRDLYDF